MEGEKEGEEEEEEGISLALLCFGWRPASCFLSCFLSDPPPRP